MDRFHEIQVFVAVAEAGGFSKAAAQLRSSPPAVTRAIASLEGRLGARLFNRTTRRLSVTEAGMRFLESARRILGDLDGAERDAVGESAMPTGHLRLTAPVTFGRTALVPIITGLLDAYPHVTASVLLLDRMVNLVEEGIDAAIRIGHLPDSSLMARHVGEVRRVLVASPDYLAKHGRPRRPSDLRRHAVIVFTGLMPNREWTFVDGRRQSRLALAPRLEINDAGAALAAAEQGRGITIALSYMVAEQIRKKRLMIVLDGFTPPPVPVQIVYPQTHLVAPKLRAFLDYATPLLRKTLATRDGRA